MYRQLHIISICFILILFGSCDTLNNEEKAIPGELDDISIAEMQSKIEANLDEQKAHINKMSNFNPVTIKTIDDQMAEIADIIPGFAGYYLEPKNPDVLNMEITDLASAQQLKKNMLPVIRMVNPKQVTSSTYSELLHELMRVYDLETAMTDKANTVIKSAKYNFRQLQNWRLSIKEYEGMTSVRIDEKMNRVEVGVSEKIYVENVRSQLINSGIPRDALSVIVKEPVKLNSSSLRNTYRPAIGGLEINRLISTYPDFVIGQCTLGFTARIDGNPYFVTNSHCSEEPFDTDSGIMYQTYSSQIGYEYYDRPTFNCVHGSKCRLSDASLYRLNSGIQYDNLIAFPDTEGSVIFDNTLTVTEVGGAPQWTPIFKVGRTTGLSGGIIWDDCQSRKGTDGIWRMCSMETSLNSSDGDSGSPVFLITEEGNDLNAKLYGVLWGGSGGDTYASHIGYIVAELGNMTITF